MRPKCGRVAGQNQHLVAHRKRSVRAFVVDRRNRRRVCRTCWNTQVHLRPRSALPNKERPYSFSLKICATIVYVCSPGGVLC